MKLKSVLVCAIAGGLAGGCQNPSQSCNSFFDALKSGAAAGMNEAITGQQAENPCLTPQNTASQDTNNDKQSYEQLAKSYGEKHAQLIMQGQIAIGMNADEVVLAWGEPESKQENGKAKTTWHYGQDKVVFTGGKVSAVTH
jgi:hypothetical protein